MRGQQDDVLTPFMVASFTYAQKSVYVRTYVYSHNTVASRFLVQFA